MALKSDNRGNSSQRWRYLAVAMAILGAGLVLAGLWQLPRLFPPPSSASATPTGSAIAPPTAVATPLPTATPTPAILHPTITGLSAEVDDPARTITFHASAQVPLDRSITEVLLWYDTETGHQVQHLPGSPTSRLDLSYQLHVAAEGLTRTLTTTAELDYWWWVRDTTGESVRAGGTVFLSPALQALVATPAPEPPPLDFAWAVSESQHFQFHYMPGTAAERDLAQLSAVAEASLERIGSVLEMHLDDQMSIYLVPRVFWQGGATYGEKVQLISYLDRNYTGVETWSYFTHEGTHALAQDLLQPKENGGGPDGVLVEGLAVWASGGHYRLEPLDEWAAVLAESEQYIPLAELRAGPFYDFQHEISYLEGGSFVKFLVEGYGLPRFKELYGQATGEAAHDEALVQRLYDRSYADLEREWLDHLAGLNPDAEQTETLWLKIRSFDLMRRYETELDPDARYLPPKPPTEWTSDTLRIFLGPIDKPLNIVLETALIAAQERIYGGDPEGASALLDDVKTALDAQGALTRPSLLARKAILSLVATQDRAVLHADAKAYRASLDPAYALALGDEVEETLQKPFTAYQQQVVRLDLSADGLRAEGMVQLHAQLAEGVLADDGHLFAVSLVKTESGWLMSNRQPVEPVLSLPPPAPDRGAYFVVRVPWHFMHYAPRTTQHAERN